VCHEKWQGLGNDVKLVLSVAYRGEEKFSGVLLGKGEIRKRKGTRLESNAYEINMIV
jgi:hypothetical protein